MLLKSNANDQNINCDRFSSARKSYSMMQRKFDVAAMEKQCYVCVAYIMHLDSTSAERSNLNGKKDVKSYTRLNNGKQDTVSSAKTIDVVGSGGGSSAQQQGDSNGDGFFEMKESKKATDGESPGGGGGGGEENTKYEDPKNSVCFEQLFSGSSSIDVIKEIKTKCDQKGIMGKLDGSATKGGSSSSSSSSEGEGEETPSTTTSTMLLELESKIKKSKSLEHLKQTMEGDDIPNWFKSLVTAGSTKSMTQRMSCLGMQLMPSDIQAAEDAVSCLDAEFGAKAGGIQQPMSKDECGEVIDTVNSVVGQRIRHMAAAIGTMVPATLELAPRYQLYKTLAMKIYGTTGEVDDSEAPYDHSVIRDLPVR